MDNIENQIATLSRVATLTPYVPVRTPVGSALPSALVRAAETWYASPLPQVVSPGTVARLMAGEDEE